MENRVMFGITERNGRWHVWNMTSVNYGVWSAPRRVSEYFDTREQAEAEVQRQANQPEFDNWRIILDCDYSIQTLARKEKNVR